MTNNELNEKDLGQVTGGYVQIAENTWHFQKGDVFQSNGAYRYYVESSVDVGKDGYVPVRMKESNSDESVTEELMTVQASELMELKFVGNIIIYK